MSEVSGAPEQLSSPVCPEQRSEAEILAAGAAQAEAVRDLEAAHSAAENPERRRAEVKVWVEAECDYFDIQPKDDPVADQLTALFCEHEQRQHARGRADYDVTQEERRRLDRIIERGFEHGATVEEVEQLKQVTETAEIEAETDEIQAEADDTAALERQAVAESYREIVSGLSGSNIEKIQHLLTGRREEDQVAFRDLIPSSELAKLEGFQRLLTLSQQYPDDAPLLAQRINTLDLSAGLPSPAQFIQTSVFSSEEFDSGFSEGFQSAVATEFGITPTRPTRPRNATEMQTALREGRGTRPVIEIQEVEEPPGSGNWLEREVVVGDEVIPFTPQDKLMLSHDPPIGIFPVSAGSQTHRVEGAAAGQPIQAFELDIPEHGALPSAEIHMQTNKNIYETLFRSRGLAGSFQALLGESDSSLAPNAETANGLTDNDALQGLNEMFFGLSDVSSRFLSGAEIQRVHDQGTRWLVPGGDFGSFTEVDTAAAQARLRALFGDDPAQMVEGMRRATPIINSGGAVTPSFEALYAGLHPDDAAKGYPQLREILGEDGVAALDLPDLAETS